MPSAQARHSILRPIILLGLTVAMFPYVLVARLHSSETLQQRAALSQSKHSATATPIEQLGPYKPPAPVRWVNTPILEDMRVHVVQLWAGSEHALPAWFHRVQNINRAYTAKHGYSYEFLKGPLTQHPFMDKIKIFNLLLQKSTKNDVFLYMDTDAVVWNASIPLESFQYRRHDMILSGHEFGVGAHGEPIHPKTPDGRPAGVNAGVWIVRGTDWSKRLFRTWIEKEDRFNADDQKILQFMPSKGWVHDFYDHVHFVRAARLNMDDTKVRLGLATRPSAEFIVHCWGGLKRHMPEVLDDIEAHDLPPRLIVNNEF